MNIPEHRHLMSVTPLKQTWICVLFFPLKYVIAWNYSTSQNKILSIWIIMENYHLLKIIIYTAPPRTYTHIGNSSKLLGTSFKIKVARKTLSYMLCIGSKGHYKKEYQEHFWRWQYQICIYSLKWAILIVKTYLDAQVLVYLLRISFFVFIAWLYYSLFSEN